MMGLKDWAVESTQEINTNSDSILPHCAKCYCLLTYMYVRTYLIGIHRLSEIFYAFTSKNVPLTLV